MRSYGGGIAVADLRVWLRNGLLLWEKPLWSMVFAFLVYFLLAQARGPLWVASPFAYYNYLADAFLHAQLHLRLIPPEVHDLVFFEDQYYLYWPPFPALLLIPFVAVFGVQFSDIFFTLGIGALNVALVALILRAACRQQVIGLSELQRSLLVLFFTLGTVHITLAPFGRIWFTGQLVGFCCVALAYLSALRLNGWKAFLLTGLALAGAALTRNHLLFAGVWPVYYLLRKHWPAGEGKRLSCSLAGLAPLALAGMLLAAYNWLRFGDPTEVGLNYHLMAQFFLTDYQHYGPFHLHYLPTNLYYQYLFYPFPLRQESLLGGSLFLLSPVFFIAFWGISTRARRTSTVALLASILLVSVPILLLMGTGWVQFGPRYTLDFTIPLLLLTGQGVPRWPIQGFGLLVFISVLHYLRGVLFFMGAV